MSETSQNGGEIDADEIAMRQRELEVKTNLSGREAEVQALKEEGLTHAEIAEEIGVEKGTVDSHAHRIKVKYDLAYHTVRALDYSTGDG